MAKQTTISLVGVGHIKRRAERPKSANFFRKSHYVSRDTQDAIAAKKADIDIGKYSDINLPPAHSADAESVLAQFGPEVAAALRTLLATARAAA